MILLKNGRLIQEGNTLMDRDILIGNGRVLTIEEAISPQEGTEVIDLKGQLVTAGFIDPHVHLREPGFTEKETIETGARAAVKGGYTTIFAMPNVTPAPDTPEKVRDLAARAERDAAIRIGWIVPITFGERGGELTDFKALKEAGAVAVSDDGKGVQSNAMMAEAMRSARENDLVLCAHCEDESILAGGYIHAGDYSLKHGHKGISRAVEDVQVARDILLAGEAGARYHICHMSTHRGVDLLKLGQDWGYRVTGEVTPHHLLLSDADLREDGRFKMNPPLRALKDRDRLIQGLKDGVIRVIATDHAPHTREEKSQGLAGSPFGITGLETAFPLLYTYLVKPGLVTLETVVNAMTRGPAEIFSLEGGVLEEGARADITVTDLKSDYVIDAEQHESKGRNTPFDGWRVFGRTELVIKDGNVIYQDGRFVSRKRQGPDQDDA